MPRIFISYRRDDTLDVTGRLHADLASNTGAGNVFKDVVSIDSSEPFEQQIFKAISRCKYLVIMIGPRWLEVRDENGDRRIDNPEDFVRREIVYAIEQNLKIVPVLVGDTSAPLRKDLPADLHPILDWQFRKLRPDPDFTRDAERILRQVKQPKPYGVLLVGTTALLLIAGSIAIYHNRTAAIPPCTVITPAQIKTAVEEGYSGIVYHGNLIDLSSRATNAFIVFHEESDIETSVPAAPPGYRLRYVKGGEEHTSNNRHINPSGYQSDTPVAGELDIGIAEWQWNCGSPHTGWLKPPGEREGWNYNLLDEYHFDKANIQNQWQNKIDRKTFEDRFDRTTIFNCATDAFIVIGESFVATVAIRCDSEVFHYLVNFYDGSTTEPIALPEKTVHDVSAPEFIVSPPPEEVTLPFSISGGRRGYIYESENSDVTVVRVAEQDIADIDLEAVFSTFFSTERDF